MKRTWIFALSLVMVAGAMLTAQQNVPDAPSAAKPATEFPTATRPAARPQQRPAGEEIPQELAPDAEAQQDDQAQAPESVASATVPPMPNSPNTEDQGYRVRVDVNFVSVPVTVKDEEGHPVWGLVAKDFAVYEDGQLYDLKYFTSDPFPLSAAIVIDQGMSSTAMRKVNQTLPAITGAFSQYDEVALYTYGNTVRTASDFRGANEQFTATLEKTKAPGQQGGVPVVSGPMAAGPTVNGRPLDPGAPRVVTPTRDSRVLNDAILKAALDLSRRDKGRRRAILVISDGQEDGSEASYNEVMKVLLSHNISVFALGVDSAALAGYQKLSRVKLPGFGTGNILPKYVSATGGQLFTEFSQEGIERAYARLAGEARNQYTLGYNTKATPSTAYRSIEVRVKRPGLRIYAKDGYYPLPRPRA